MGDDLMTVLSADAEATDANAPSLSDRELRDLYEALVLTRAVDEHVARLQRAGKVGIWAPSAEAAAVSVGAASALSADDWLYPSHRDVGGFLARGGGLRQLLAQFLGTAGDVTRGRQVAGHPSLPGGRFVPSSAALGTQVQHAAGTALAMKIRGRAAVALALCGGAAADQAAFCVGLETAVRHRAPLVVVCRTGDDHAVARRAGGHGLEAARVDGGDVLAVLKATAAARDRALAGDGPALVEARVAPAARQEDAPDALDRLQPYLEHRGLLDPGRAAEARERADRRVAEAVEAESAQPRPPVESLLEDVLAADNWLLDEAREHLAGGDSDDERGR